MYHGLSYTVCTSWVVLNFDVCYAVAVNLGVTQNTGLRESVSGWVAHDEITCLHTAARWKNRDLMIP